MSLFDLVAQQPRLTSIRRDRDELQKKIDKLQKRRDECVGARKMSEVCAGNSPSCSTVLIQMIVHCILIPSM